MPSTTRKRTRRTSDIPRMEATSMKTVLMCLLAAFCGVAVAAEGPFSISVDPQNNTFLRVFGSAPELRESTARLATKAAGSEKSECRDYGRRSAADATADVEVISRTADAVSLKLVASALAMGGHYRTCVQCVLGNCVGLMGNDTRGEARATS